MGDEGTEGNCTVTAVMPAYNEAGRIGETIRSVAAYVDRVVVIDDASTYATATKAREAGATVVTHSTNQGYIASIESGFSRVDDGIVVTVDADGELPAGCIPDLVRPVCRGEADMMQGQRGQIVRPTERFLTWLAGWGGEVGDSGTGFRALRVDLAKTLELRGACICGVFSLEVLGRDGHIEEVPVQLNNVDKPRGIAWHHFRQVFYVVAALLQKWLTS